jgi:hypothetical protein
MLETARKLREYGSEAGYGRALGRFLREVHIKYRLERNMGNLLRGVCAATGFEETDSCLAKVYGRIGLAQEFNDASTFVTIDVREWRASLISAQLYHEARNDQSSNGENQAV